MSTKKKQHEEAELATAPIVLDYLKVRAALKKAKDDKRDGDICRKHRDRAELLLGAMTAAAQRVALRLSWDAGTGDL